MCLWFQVPWHGIRTHFNFLGSISVPTHFSPLLFSDLRQILPRVMLLANLSLVLVAPLWLQKQWFTDLLTHLVGKPLKTPFAVVSSGPVSCQGVSLGSEMLQLHVWMLSSVSSTSLAYWEGCRDHRFGPQRIHSCPLPGKVVLIPPLVSWTEYLSV